MRRHNGVPLPEFSSPSKEDLRRRLFDTPQKSGKMKYKGNGSSLQLSKSTIVAFIGLGVLLLLGVHAYLLQTTLSQNSVNSTVATLPDDASWPIVYTGPLRQRSIPLAKRKLQPLEEKDWNQYTIRINTWRRPEQLLASVAWHSQCPGVAQIQIIWCDLENEPPTELEKYGNVVIERHLANNLNERFNVLIPPLTIGILSIDDDVLRPCESIDAGFFKWTQSPDRMVGFDGRLHVEKEDGSWNYGYMSTTERANKYSISLTRYCFVHRDYMEIYMNELPRPILDSVAENFNCEDVAMSFLISSLTNGKPPLLADAWAIKSMIKLYVPEKISGTKNHKHLRNVCVDSFAQTLGLKGEEESRRLRSAKFYHEKNPMFDCGDVPRHINKRDPKSDRQLALEEKIRTWQKAGGKVMQEDLRRLMSAAAQTAFRAGLIANSEPWKARYHRMPAEDG